MLSYFLSYNWSIKYVMLERIRENSIKNTGKLFPFHWASLVLRFPFTHHHYCRVAWQERHGCNQQQGRFLITFACSYMILGCNCSRCVSTGYRWRRICNGFSRENGYCGRHKFWCRISYKCWQTVWNLHEINYYSCHFCYRTSMGWRECNTCMVGIGDKIFNGASVKVTYGKSDQL